MIKHRLLFMLGCLLLASLQLLAQTAATPPPAPPEAETSQQPPQLPSPAGVQNGRQMSPASQPATVVGTVTDVNDDPILGADVVLEGPALTDRRTAMTDENGFFEIRDAESGLPYHVNVSSLGFRDWTSPAFTLEPGQYKILDVGKLRIKELQTTVTVTPESSDEIAIQQVKVEEKQRGFGVIPNFFEVYEPNPAPLTAKLKFKLSFRVARDPFSIAGVAMLAGVGQSAKKPYYGVGFEGFAQRFAADYTTQFSDIMIGGAILPSLLHQDPRYYYKGTGTKKSRFLHAISNIIITRGDSGHLQPNYSTLGGDLASAAISNAYYPGSNRGAPLVFENFGINTAVHMFARILQEFVFRPANLQANPAPLLVPQAAGSK
jgi:hypothetical protein